MMHRLSHIFSNWFKAWMPDAFVFALALTLLCMLVVGFITPATPLEILEAWYKGFWDLLEFGMQMVLILVTGYAIALSSPFQKMINRLALHVNTPTRVYLVVMLAGAVFSFVSWSWIVITALLARQLAEKVKGVDYPYLVACVYLTFHGWVGGLSSTIPLLLNTPNNFLIQQGVIDYTLPTSKTLATPLNLAFIIFILTVPPILMVALRPRSNPLTIEKLLLDQSKQPNSLVPKKKAVPHPQKSIPTTPSDLMNQSRWLLMPLAFMGLFYLGYHFYFNGFSLDLPIMIFAFLMVGMAFHQTPIRYVLAMKKASANISGIVFQYPFYAGIMGIMLYTGLGEMIGQLLGNIGTVSTYPAYSFLAGALINFAIPSAGGEFAVLAPGIVSAVQQIGEGLPQPELSSMIARASMAIAYGESLTNLLQPFFLLTITPVMFQGVKIQIRDVLGYLFIPFFIYLILELLLVSYFPM